MVDPDLAVTEAVAGCQPIGVAFLGRDDMLVLEKASGQVKHVVRGQVRDVALDLAVNSGSERGLLGIALHPKFNAQRLGLPVLEPERAGRGQHDLADVRLHGQPYRPLRVGRATSSSSTATSSRSAPTRTTPPTARCAATTTAA